MPMLTTELTLATYIENINIVTVIHCHNWVLYHIQVGTIESYFNTTTIEYKVYILTCCCDIIIGTNNAHMLEWC